MNKFEAFNIRSIPRSMNYEDGMLANAASNLSPSDDFTSDKFFWNLFTEAVDTEQYYKLEDL